MANTIYAMICYNRDVRTLNHKLPIEYGRCHNMARNMRFVIYVIKMKLGMNATTFWNANFLTVFEKTILTLTL